MTYHQQRAWLWSRDCFKILPLVVMQRDARVCQRQRSYQRQLSYLSAFVIIAQDLGIMSAIFAFFGGTIPLKLSLLRGSRPISVMASPHIWPTLFQISSKSVHFRRCCQTREDRFCPVEYLQYRLFEPITTCHWHFNYFNVASVTSVLGSHHVIFSSTLQKLN